ncbi:hypothetical protein JWG44_11650 [Leptospira sp. 201903071]|uniref:hypothetical protein n=1 Tax=Leptospira ainazelensis TaxID=2810034 RepID=UPI001962CB83|nr:hypothetical protein [Leptospira ainazelensis]MBM9500904.1 hypothetical protein [Leptospira ainazelensis]
MNLFYQTLLLFMSITILSFLTSPVKNRNHSPLKWILLILILLSISIGTVYAYSIAIPKAVNGNEFFSMDMFSIFAAIIFIFSQVRSFFLLADGKMNFFVWLVPFCFYLLIIGLYQWIFFGTLYPLFLDSLRGLILFFLGYKVKQESSFQTN